MPLVKISTNVQLDAAAVETLTSTAHNTIKSVLGKPDQYICIDVTPSPNMQFGGTKEPAAVASVHSIGFGSGSKSRANREAIVRALTEALYQVGSIPADRIFVALQDVKGDEWGWNGGLLG